MQDLSDLSLPEEGKTIIVNATLIQERVLVPRQRIIWYIHGWTRGPVIATDRESVLIFDFDKRQLHTISLRNPAQTTYVMHQMFNVFTEGEKLGADIIFSPSQVIQPVESVVGERWLGVLLLSRIHPPTYQRLLAMRQ